MFLLQAALRCCVYKLLCLDGNCSEHYTGDDDCVFFLSKQTCVGDEIAWDFISRITTSNCSFTSFCSDMCRIYTSNFLIAHPFLSRSTFVKFWFAWLAAHNIDFRKGVDRWCGPDRKLLACDGTHVGVSLTRLDVQPVEKPDVNGSIVGPGHRRYDRVFLFYPERATASEKQNIRAARKHLKYIAEEAIGVENSITPTIEERQALDNLLLHVSPQNNSCQNVLKLFLRFDLPPNLKRTLGKVFAILAADAPLSAFMPLRYHDDIITLCSTAREGIIYDSEHQIDKMYQYCPELADLFRQAPKFDVLLCIVSFVEYLVSFIKQIHESDPCSEPAVPAPGTYDPESGVAYYFTDHGQKVHSMPTYELDTKRHAQDLFDDAPHQDTCIKFPAPVTYGGFNYTFFWFCPVHGHCLGYHLIPGHEGRKDPFSSLYAYLPDPPKEIFYDFACSLNEYCLNREPRFFRDTRFWHDLFHGYSHKCAVSFNSSRIRGLDVTDTEICEQFNSFLGKIKYTGSHMTQSHFCLFLQFMINIWNEKKDKRCESMQDVVLAINELDT